MESEFEQLTQSQQTEVLRYLEATGSDNIQEAISTLRRFNMSSQEAINFRFNRQQNHHYNEYDEFDERPRQVPLNREQEQQLARYNTYLRQVYLERSSLWFIVKYYGGALLGIAKGLAQCLLPRPLKRVIFYSKFEKLYKDSSKITLFEKGLDKAFDKGVNDQKCIAIIVSTAEKSPDIVQLLSERNDITKQLTTRIITLGVINNSPQYKKLKTQVDAPYVIFAYKTIFGQIKTLSTKPVKQITQQVLKNVIAEYRTQKRKQKNIVIRFKNRISLLYQEGQIQMQQQIPESRSYEHDRLIVAQQKQEYEQASKIRKQSIIKQQQQRVRKQSLIQQRKARKLSLPDEPQQGQIVLLNFRCPNGTKIQRKFDKQDKIQILYHWVQTNQQIQFEQQPQRKFQLLRGYHPEPLRQKMDKKIKQQIQDQREIILIRQL